MSDLSLNPLTWTPSNLAEAAVQGLTGSEFAGDVAGAIFGFATGDVFGGAEQVFDGADNVGGFLGAVGGAVAQAADQYFGTGSVSSPSQCQLPNTGWDPIKPIETQQTQETKPTYTQQSSDPLSGLDLSKMSLEEAIFMILAKLIDEKRGEVKDKVDKIAKADKEGKVDMGGGESMDKETALQKLQFEQNQLQQMTTLLSGMMASFNQMNQSIIQNIR